MSIENHSFRWTSASRSHPGRVREVNEDACLDQSEHELWAVADGMGGHTLGEFASGLAVQGLMDLPAAEDLAHGSSDRADSEEIPSGDGVALESPGLEQRVTAALDRLQEVNRRLRAEALRREVPLIGTTIAALVAAGNHCTCLWAGDSRIYLLRDRCLRQLTRDHNHLEAARSRYVSRSDDTLARRFGAAYAATEPTLDPDRTLDAPVPPHRPRAARRPRRWDAHGCPRRDGHG